MPLNLITLFCLTVWLFLLRGVWSQDYSTLEALGVACEDHRDSCHFTNRLNFTSRSCECDKSCGFFQDCCIDAPFRPTAASQRMRQKLTCLPLGESPYLGAYMVDSCPLSYGDRVIESKCRNASRVREPLLSAPVTDVINQVTYKNRYCANCHSVPLRSTKTWIIVTQCRTLTGQDVDTSTAWDSIRFDERTGKWAVEVDGELHGCDVEFEAPASISRRVRLCRAGLVVGCPRSWSRESVRRLCHSYEAVIFHGTRAFKNSHCAICHGVPVTELSCLLPPGVASRRRNAFAFGMLLDVNESDGEDVGMVRRCPRHQTYDPFLKTCHNLSCGIPGYIQRNGQCVRI